MLFRTMYGKYTNSCIDKRSFIFFLKNRSNFTLYKNDIFIQDIKCPKLSADISTPYRVLYLVNDEVEDVSSAIRPVPRVDGQSDGPSTEV